MSFREAILDDVPALVGLLRQFTTSPDYARYLSDDLAQATRCLTWLITDANGCIFVAARGDTILGLLGASIYPHPMSGERVASEVVWWLDETARGPGVWLCRRFERWARANGATRAQMMHPIAKARVGAVYQALGYVAIETLYQKDLV